MAIQYGKDMESVIRSITEKVLKRILEQENIEAGALVLAPSFIPDAAPIKDFIKENCKNSDIVYAGEGAQMLGKEIRPISIDTAQDMQRLMAGLKNYKKIIMVTPQLWMLKNIADGDDKGFFEQIFMRSLLWGKQVYVVLDFERPKFKRGTFFESISDTLGAIEEMGAEVVSLKLSVEKKEVELLLVTEADVIDASKQGRESIRCGAGAIVTSLARDTAKELGIEIVE